MALLRNTEDIDGEMEDLLSEAKGSSGNTDPGENITIIGLFTDRDCRWPIITAIIIHITQQLCGINAVSWTLNLLSLY